MSAQATLKTVSPPIENVFRPNAYFAPSVWGDRFLTFNHIGEFKRVEEEEMVEELKEKVRRQLHALSCKPSQQLQLIDTIQRLGIAYQFDEDIKHALNTLNIGHDSTQSNDLYATALFFRHLRQQGFNVSSEIFQNFMDKDKCEFRLSLVDDIVGMLAFYEATHLRVHGEDILERALSFTATNLESALTQNLISDPLKAQVEHALKQPIRKGLTRLEAIYFIPLYEQDAMHDKTLSKLAKLDFNLLQQLHQKELSELSRWNTKCLGMLPDYMKPIYQALLDVFEEIEDEMNNEGKSYRVYYAKDAMKLQVSCYYEEAKRLHEKFIPTMEEYMPLALLSCGYLLLSALSFVGMGDIVTEDTMKWVLAFPKLVKAASTVNRLMDDIVSHKMEQDRGHVASGIECYVKQYEVSEKYVYDLFNNLVEDAWKDINQESLVPQEVEMPIVERVINLARAMDVFYKNEDTYTHVGKLMKERVESLLVYPII